MYISKVVLRNYRCWKSAEIKLGKFNVIIGKNDSGKSSILYAINLFFDNLKGGKKVPDINDFYISQQGERSDKIEIGIYFRLEDSDLEQLENDDTYSEILEGLGGNIEDILEALGIINERELGYKIEFKREKKENNDEKESIKFRPYISFKIFEGLEEIYKKGKRDLEKIAKENNIKPTSHLITTLFELYRLLSDNKNYKSSFIPVDELARDIKSFLKPLLELLKKQARNFYFFRAYEPISTEHSSFQNVFRDIIDKSIKDKQDIIRSLEDAIREILKDKVKKLEEIMREHMESISNIKFEPEFDWKKGILLHVYLADEQSNIDIPVSKRGMGIQRQLMMAILKLKSLETIESNRGSNIFALEEPELYLHPGAQRYLLYNLKKLCEQGHQIILTTHSMVFVDRSDISEIILVRKKGDFSEARNIESKKHDLIEVLNELGYKLSDMLFADGILLVEGLDDKLVYSAWADIMGFNFEEHKIDIIILSGKDNAERYCKAFLDLFKKYEIPYVLILDKDAENTAKELEKEGLGKIGIDIFVLNKGELEDYYDPNKIPIIFYEAINSSEIKILFIKQMKDRLNKNPNDITEIKTKYRLNCESHNCVKLIEKQLSTIKLPLEEIKKTWSNIKNKDIKMTEKIDKLRGELFKKHKGEISFIWLGFELFKDKKKSLKNKLKEIMAKKYAELIKKENIQPPEEIRNIITAILNKIKDAVGTD